MFITRADSVANCSSSGGWDEWSLALATSFVSLRELSMFLRRTKFMIAGLFCLALINGATLLAQSATSSVGSATNNVAATDNSSQSGLWEISAGCLALLLSAGFALIAGGMVRPKNSAHQFAVNLMIVPLAGCAVFLYGFALGWGNLAGGAAPPGWSTALGSDFGTLNHGLGIESASDSASNAFTYGILGTKGFCLAGLNGSSVIPFFFLMTAYLIVAAIVATGALAERWAWRNFVLYGFWVVVPLALVANWIWGGGWLAQMGKNWKLGHGAVDFAGSGVIHAVAGAIGLAGTICIGPRLGKFVNRKPRAVPGHNVPYVVLGTLILLISWFGLTGGSILSGTDLKLGSIAVNTALGAFGGALASMFYLMFSMKRPDPTMMCNGLVAGLVSISAACAFVDPWAALLIGAVGGVLVVVSVLFWDKLEVDDPVGSISMHGAAGVWGLIAVGLFATGQFGSAWNGVVRDEYTKLGGGTDGVRGLFYGDGGQLVAQLIAAAVVTIFGFVAAYALFKLSELITPLRVSRDVEFRGLDGSEMGTLAYPDFVLKSTTLDA
jgi:Amt family ammonium transporter